MAISKFTRIKLVPGNINEKNLESEVFSESRTPLDGEAAVLLWASGITYAKGDALLYENLSYNSLINGNTGNQPDSSPSEWSLVDGKDGDIWIQVPVGGYPTGGGDTEIYIKNLTVWRALSGANPKTIALVDGQLTEETAFEFPAGFLPYATIEYTVRRGSSHGRKRAGTFKILNSGGDPEFTHEFTEIGNDVNVPFTVDYSGGKVRLRYTSVNESSAIELRFSLKGWA